MPGTLPLRAFDLVIADIDGCLVGERPGPFDLGALGRVAEHNRLAVERGDRPLVSVCSGRPQPFAEAICRLIGNTLMPCVCENGVWVYHPGTNEYVIDPAITQDDRACVHELARWAALELGAGEVSQQPGKTASVTLYHPDAEHLRARVFPLVRAQVEAMRWPFRVSMTWFYINCDLRHVSKGTGLDRMLAGLHIPRARLAGIGDTEGDHAIRERVAWFACPSNAQAAIKDHAHYVSPAPEARGVVDILGQVVGSARP